MTVSSCRSVVCVAALALAALLPVAARSPAAPAERQGAGEEYQTALKLANDSFKRFQLKRSDFVLTDVASNLLLSHCWKLTYVSKSCLDKGGLRHCKGGYVVLTVTTSTRQVSTGYGE